MRLIITRLAPEGLWQDGRSCAHPDVRPVLVNSKRAFRKLCRAATTQCGGRLPPSSRTLVDELLKAPSPAQQQVQGLRARLAQMVQGAGLAVGDVLAAPLPQ